MCHFPFLKGIRKKRLSRGDEMFVHQEFSILIFMYFLLRNGSDKIRISDKGNESKPTHFKKITTKLLLSCAFVLKSMTSASSPFPTLLTLESPTKTLVKRRVFRTVCRTENNHVRCYGLDLAGYPLLYFLQLSQ